MFIDSLLAVFERHRAQDAVIWRDRSYSYAWLLDRVRDWGSRLSEERVLPGTVAGIEADFSPNGIALFLALAERRCILVPLTTALNSRREEYLETAQAQVSFILDSQDHSTLKRLPFAANHEFYDKLRAEGHPGLIIFTSGSTGKSKAAVHDLSRILRKFDAPRNARRGITFLLFDHIGGVNTMLAQLSSAGCIITIEDRSPDSVLGAVAKYRIENLAVSPTFMNLMLLSEAAQRHNLESLKLVSYGTEPMPESTLRRFNELFPQIKVIQLYGMSEIGILRTRSRASDSVWIKIDGEDFQTRVIDGVLQVKAETAMLGYLNAPSPFTADGWLITGDMVEVDGEYLRILGRKSELINVGGEKVYPAAVESVIQELENVAEVSVYGEKNPIVGQIVCAAVRLLQPENSKEFARRLKQFCRGRLENFKIPVKVKIVESELHGERFKKIRREDAFPS